MTFQPRSNPVPTPVIHSSNPISNPFQPRSNPVPTPTFQPPISKDIGPALAGGPISEFRYPLVARRQDIAIKQIRLATLLAEVRDLRAELAAIDMEAR